MGTDIFPDKADWKALIKRRVEMHRSWCGELPSSITRYHADEVVFSDKNVWSHMAKLQHAFDVAKKWQVNHNGVSDDAMIVLSSRDTLHESASAREVMDRIKTFLRIGVELTLLEEKAMMAATGLTLQRFRGDNMVPVIGMMVPSVRNVRRIKVDERNGFFLTTQVDGGLIVSDISTSQMLWCTPRVPAHQSAELEYDQGYAIIPRPDGSKEVWRSSSISSTAGIPATHTPDLHQRVASALANGGDDEFLRSIIDPAILADTTPPDFLTSMLATRRQIRKQEGQGIGILDATMLASAFSTSFSPSELRYDQMGWITLFDLCQVTGIDFEKYFPQQREDDEDDDDDKRLSAFFEPHLIIPVSMRGQAGSQTPDPTSHSRFVYPYLIASSQTQVYIWDVRTGEEIQTVASIQQFTVPWEETMRSAQRNAQLKIRAEFDDILRELKRNSATSIEDKTSEDTEAPFPSLPLFKTGYFNENATFSGNIEPMLNLMGKPELPNAQETGDPLSLATNPPGVPLGDIMSVELGERWIFVAGREGLRVFARGTEFFDAGGPNSNFAEGQLVLRIPSDKIHYSRWNAALGAKYVRPHWGSETVRQEVIWNKEVDWMSEDGANSLPVRDYRYHNNQVTLGQPKIVRRRLEDMFFAVRISPDQKHLVAMLITSRLLFIPYFERVISGEANLWDVAIDIQLGGVRTPSVALSYGTAQSGSGGSAGRITAITRSGIFIVTPYLTGMMKTSTSSSTGDPTREVDITVHRLAPSFMDPDRLSRVDSLEMSDSGIWIDWITSKKPSPPVNPFCQGDSQFSCRFPGKVPDWWWKQAFDLAADDPESKKEILAATIPDHWRKSIEDEARFRDSLKEWRVSQAGISGAGVQVAPGGNYSARLDMDLGRLRNMDEEGDSEVYHISFVPTYE
ncbi:hypothetical protein DFP72DRAFT_1067550 [Ephemerocybe angulata]|uniref:Uncharacterized protein n=1 Tax=Ephemerocybe angulata TaxID=980116 RepID=A0A8H6HYU1_9AGAR|nr:hypothetical protein DFP72DRAFT_1067550 [Tulosesus angulatus]